MIDKKTVDQESMGDQNRRSGSCKKKKSESYIDKKTSKEPLLNTKKDDCEVICLDSFKLLDQKNEGFLDVNKLSQIPDEHDSIKQLFKDIDDKYLMSQQEFTNKIMEAQITTQNLNNMQRDLYSKKFGGRCASILCSCCKNKCRANRRKRISSSMDEMSHEKESKAKDRIILFNMTLQKLFTGISGVLDEVTDAYLLYKIYQLSQIKNDKIDYSIATIVIFQSLMSPYLIQVSTMINLMYYKGYFEPVVFKNKSCCTKFISFINFSFLAPGKVLSRRIREILQLAILSLLIFIPGNFYKKAKAAMTRMVNKYFGIGEQDSEYIKAQQAITKLLFSTLPMLFLQIFLFTHIISCPEILKEKQAIYLSTITTWLALISNTSRLYLESRMYDEPFILYCMNCMKAKQGWIPFVYQIRQSIFKRNIDYSKIQKYVPGLTNKLGFYMNEKFIFEDETLKILATELTFWDISNKDTESNVKFSLNMAESIDNCSVNVYLHLYTQIPRSHFDHDTSSINFEQLVINEKAGLVTEHDKFKKYTSRLPSGVLSLRVCIDSESTEDESWPLQECMKLLLAQGCDPNSVDQTGENIIFHAIRTKKVRSLKLLIDNDVNLKVTSIDQITSPFGEALKQADIRIVEMIYDGLLGHIKSEDSVSKRAKYLQEIQVKDKSIKKRGAMTPLHYLAKRLRHNSREIGHIRFKCKPVKKPEKDLYKFFIDNNIKVQSDLDKQAVFRQIAMLFGMEDLLGASLLFYLIGLYPNFDLLEGRDKKGSNIGHILEKNYEYSVDNKADVFCVYDPQTEKHMNTQWFKEFWKEASNSCQTEEEFFDRFKTLLQIPNNKGKSPLVTALLNNQQERACIAGWYVYLTDQFDFKSEKAAKDYIYNKAKNFKTQSNNIWTKFKDSQSAKQELINKAKEDKDYKVLANLSDENVDYNEDDEQNDDNIQSHDLQNTKGKGNLVRQVQFSDKAWQSIKKEDSQIKILSQQELKKYTQSQNQDHNNKWLYEVLILILEVLAAMDLYSDIYILVQLVYSNHIAWAAITIYSLASPYFISYVPLINFQIQYYEQNYHAINKSKKKQLEPVLILLPFVIIYLMTMDVFYIIASVGFTSLLLLLKTLTCGRLRFFDFSHMMDKVYNYLFHMKSMDVEHFRHLRTISQLSFESIPQIILQIRILTYSQSNSCGVSTLAIILSLVCAFGHGILELIFLKLEAQACKTQFSHYFSICFTGRLGWVPFTNKFDQAASGELINLNDVLNYDKISSKLCGATLSVQYEFTDQTAQIFIKSVSGLPIETNQAKRLNVKIGRSIENISYRLFIDLLQVSYQRINLDVDDVNIENMIKSSEATLEQIKNFEEDHAKESMIHQMVFIGQSKVVLAILKLGGIIYDETIYVAFEKQDAQMIQAFVDSENERFYDLLRTVKLPMAKCDVHSLKDPLSVFEQLLKLKELSIIEVLMNSQQLKFAAKFQKDILDEILKFVEAGDMELAHKYLSAFLGPNELPGFMMKPSHPEHLESRRYQHFIGEKLGYEQKIERVSQKIEDYQNQFPKQVYVISDCQIGLFKTTHLFRFKVFRRHLINEWQLLSTPKFYGENKDRPLNMNQYKLDLATLEIICNLISSDPEDRLKVGNLTKEMVKKCDQLVQKLGIDIVRQNYFFQSRRGDTTGSQKSIEVPIENQVVQANQDTPDPAENQLSIQRWYRPKDVLPYKIPQDAIAIKRIWLKFRFGGRNSCVYLLYKNRTLEWYNNIYSHFDHNKMFSQIFEENQKEVPDRLQEVTSSLTGGDELILQIASWSGTITQLDKHQLIIDYYQKLD